jgi:UrcA family protein
MRNTTRSLLAGLFGVGLLCGAAQAQGLYDNDYARSDSGAYGSTYTGSYSDRDSNESVTVQAPHGGGDIQKKQLIGRHNGEINPVQYSLSSTVSFADLDLSRSSDREMLHARILGTARDLCGQLSSASPIPSDQDENRECVRSAANNAMRDAGIG